MSKEIRMPTQLVFLSAAIAGACLLPLGAAAAYDPAAQFSSTQNPSGVWSYGWSQSLDSAFTLDQRHPQGPDGLDYWTGEIVTDAPPPSHFPLIGFNGTGHRVLSSNTVDVLPGELWLHPGPGGEYSVLRFTADAAGSFVVRGRFMGVDLFPGTTDVHVLVNGHSAFDGVVNTYRAGPSFRSVQQLQAGDVIDFAVGYGNGTYFNDSTRLQARIAPVPEPSTAVLWVLGLGLCTAARRRAHKAADLSKGQFRRSHPGAREIEVRNFGLRLARHARAARSR
jgi:hypothetical protein